MSDKNVNETVAELATAAVEPNVLARSSVYAIPNGSGTLKVVDTDAYGDFPRRAAASRSLSDARSFVNYLARHGIESVTEVFADKLRSAVVAIVDSHAGAMKDPGWQGHTVTLKLEHTKSWTAWLESDGKLFGQAEFAEFIEQRATDVRQPSAGDLMTLAQTFHMTKDLEFQSTERLSDGQTELVYKEKVTTKGNGKTEIPKELLLILQPYVAGPRQECFAALRTRLQGGTLLIGYVLIRPEEILDGIFADIIAEIRDGKVAIDGWPAFDGIEAPIYYGRPQ